MESFRWRVARANDRQGLQQLLREREDAWASLIDRFSTAGGNWHTDYTVLEDRNHAGHFAACLYLNEQGLAILAVSPYFTADIQEQSLLHIRHQRLSQLFCLMGSSEYALRIQYALPSSAIATTRYWLMSRANPQPDPETVAPADQAGQAWPTGDGRNQDWHGLQLRRAQVQDAGNLFELQAMYELEEVLVPGHHLNNELTRRQLAQNLNQQCIWLAAAGNLMVAKAGTNARSWSFAQIGGVFTLPAWRNRGIGEQLMKALLQDIFSAGLGACLFVKQANAPALQLYEKLGFIATGELIISYF